MKKFTRWFTPLLVVVVLGGLAVAGASARSTGQKAGAATLQACALLPDTVSSTRYTLFDAPYLKKAFAAAHVSAQVLNAHADPQKQKSQAQQCLAQGAKVILLDQLTPASGIAITNLAVAGGAKVIDYDRLVVGSKAAYYVSFDNVKVGNLQGKGLVGGLKKMGVFGSKPVVAELNGGITDNNAKLFKKGYDAILNPLYNSGKIKKAAAGDQWTDWNPTKARTIFDQMLARNSNKINGVLAANDGIAGAVIASLKAHGLKPRRADRTGRDADRRAVHPRRLADRHRLQVGQRRGQGRGRRRDQHHQGQAREDQRQGERDAVDPADADLDHEGELQAPLQGRLPQADAGLRR